MSIAIAKMYRKAAGRLEQGWIQHNWFNDQGECLVQAMGRAAGLTKEGNITRKLPLCQVEPLVKELGLKPTAYTRAGLTKALWEWNDEEGRTQADVTSLLRRVANSLDAQNTGYFALPLFRKPAKAVKKHDDQLTPVA